MRYALTFALGVAVSMLAGPCAFAASAEAGDWPTLWQVNGNGMTGTLEFSVDDKGTLSGHLLDAQVEGFVSGRRLFIRRSSGDRVEVWEGWLARPRQIADTEASADRNLIVAGSISVTDAGQTRVYPWFATTVSSPATPSTAGPGEPVAPVAAADSRSSSGDSLSGSWSDGEDVPIEIDQQGSQLTVTLSDGSSHSGRMTGASTLVVGLRKGCCNGTLETEDIIVWSDGARWKRTD